MAKHNYLCMRSEEIQGIVSGIGRTSSSVSSAGAGMKGKFAPATSSGLMTKQVGAVSKQMHAISSSMNNIQGIVNKQTNQMFEFDTTMAKKANDIEIPTDFLAHNSIKVNEYNRFLLGKIDGRSVNEGETAKQFKEIDEYKVSAENLTNISGNVTELQNYDSSSVIGRSILGKIDGDVTQLQHYDSSSGVQKTQVVNISGDTTSAKEYDSSSSVQKSASMDNINKGETKEVIFDESTVLGKSVLGSMNTSADAVSANLYKDSGSRIAAVDLSAVGDKKIGHTVHIKDDEGDSSYKAQGIVSTAYSAGTSGSLKTATLKSATGKDKELIYEIHNVKPGEKPENGLYVKYDTSDQKNRK